MFETLKRLYANGEGKLTKEMLANAVVKKWITVEQYTEICGDSYNS